MFSITAAATNSLSCTKSTKGIPIVLVHNKSPNQATATMAQHVLPLRAQLGGTVATAAQRRRHSDADRAQRVRSIALALWLARMKRWPCGNSSTRIYEMPDIFGRQLLTMARIHRIVAPR